MMPVMRMLMMGDVLVLMLKVVIVSIILMVIYGDEVEAEDCDHGWHSNGDDDDQNNTMILGRRYR